MRTLLRIENLFAKLLKNQQDYHAHLHHNAMLYLFQVMDVMDRGDIKNELLQELERQASTLTIFRNSPEIDNERLEATLAKVNESINQLRNSAVKPVQELKQNEWLMSIKQRAVIPAGLCEFDMPSYHFWLNQPDSQRQQDLASWIAPILPIYQATQVLLELLRGSAEGIHLVAENGVFQQMLNTVKPVQMVRVGVNEELNCFPEISANKYAIHIRFMHINQQRQSSACPQPVHFQLSLAYL